jgi:putative FmdB family regulatory protein
MVVGGRDAANDPLSAKYPNWRSVGIAPQVRLDYPKRLMPIYEYECTSCGRVGSHVMLGSQRNERPACPYCRSARTERVMSSFAVVASEASRLASFDTTRPRDGSFYRDSRNVGLWAKKRAKEMGVDLGSKFDETVESARSGKMIKEMG